MNALQRLEIVLSLVFPDAERRLSRPKTNDDVDWKLEIRYHDRKISIFWSSACAFSITGDNWVQDAPELPVAIIETICFVETGHFTKATREQDSTA
jgi:hypothetical protein